jgi:3-hydroxyisobutyrate dehydrogenase
MGNAFAARLLACGFKVNVWSRHPASTTSSIALGATGYANAADAVVDAEVVVTMLSTAEATRAVMFDANVLETMGPNTTWAQMATIGVATTEQFHAEMKTKRSDIVFVDAPVSGSRGPAESGQLLILASGPERTNGAIDAVFAALGRSTMWLGPVGAGSAMKLVLNTWLAFQIEGAAESASLAQRLGVDSELLYEALHDSPLASGFAVSKLERMLKEDYHPDFSLDWALKDLDLASAASGVRAVPVAAAIAERWRDLVRNGSSGLDVSAARRGFGELANNHAVPMHR